VTTILLAVSIAALVLSALACALAAWATIKVEAMARSTHQVTYIDPIKQAFDTIDKDTGEKLNKSMDPSESID
jgi:HAMP domain-containing protein